MMKPIQTLFTFLLLLVSADNYAQLGFCTGSKGDPVFSENFGNGNTATPLPPGTTTYLFSPTPNDGCYALLNHSNFFQPSWHVIPDHTPDATNGPSGKMLIVNADTAVAGDFFKKTVTGLCINTTFEFSAWMINLYNPTSNACHGPTPQIPINVRFEIWNATETTLLASGDTGNIFGTPAPLWQQFAIAFTTGSETSVVLKMRNNGVGGCGNDLAIDDIEFRACADLTSVGSSPATPGNTFTTCTSPASIALGATTASAVPYFYQWQSSADGTTWTDIPGENNPTYTPSVTTKTYFRVRAAQDLANLSNLFCSTASNIFTINLLPSPAPASNDGDRTICSGDPIPTLSVTVPAGTGVNWYNASSGGTLLQANSTTYTPTAAGTYYAETYNTTSNCIGSPRTAVQLTIVSTPNVTISAPASICAGNIATIAFTGTPNAIVTYTINGGSNQTITLNASGTASLNPALTTNTTYTLVSVNLGTCNRLKNDTVTVMVNGSATATVSSVAQVCHGSPATIHFDGTPNATVTYFVNTGANQTIPLDASGDADIVIPSVTTATTYTLVKVDVGGVCSQMLTQSVTVSPVALPNATVTATPLVICSNQSSAITFSGTPNATVTYKVNGGANQTINLGGTGSATINPTLTTSTTYTLVSAALPAPNTCSNSLVGSAMVTVNALPTASISSPAPVVCSGSPATVNFSGTPNATITYSVGSSNQSITLNAAGNASVNIANLTATTIYTLIDVTSTGPNGCTKLLSEPPVTLSATPLPTASLTANPLTVCSGQSSTIRISGTPNAVVTYTINGGANQTATLNGSGWTDVNTGPLLVNTTYQLVHVSLAGCNRSLGTSVAVSINPTPNVTYTGNLNYCDGDPITVNLFSSIAGTTFSWTVNQIGTSGASAGTGNQITQALALTGNTTGTTTYTVTPLFNGCTGNPINITVTTHAVPVPQVTDGVICTTGSGPSQFYTLDTQLNAANHTFQWFFGGGLIPGASASTYVATQIGLYTVIATNAAGCVSDPALATVGQMPQGESLVIQPSAAFSDDPMVTITVIGGGGPFSYQLDQGAFQPSNVFLNVSAGTHTITVVDEFCTNLTGSVTILDYPKYFTPNEDGYHDTWNIKGIDDAVIRIFDRYGKLLKQISPEGSGWDGTYNGHLLPSTDYWFTIDYLENGSNKTFKAHFSLKR